MKITVKSTKISRREKGFTLVELLIVVVILGILAAVVIPQFSGSTQNAKISALKSDLATVRGALELYALQHNDQYPDATSDSDEFIKQLTAYTNASHATSTSVNPSYPYGPYIRHNFPKNPFVEDPNDAQDIKIDITNSELGNFSVVGGDEGWLYKALTGEFVANDNVYCKY